MGTGGMEEAQEGCMTPKNRSEAKAFAPDGFF